MNLITLLLQAAPAAGDGGLMGQLGNFLPIILIFVVFYFFMIRPQMKKQKETRKFREEIKKGDSVMTISGIHGKVSDVKEATILMEIAPNVKITVEKSGVIADASSMPQQR